MTKARIEAFTQILPGVDSSSSIILVFRVTEMTKVTNNVDASHYPFVRTFGNCINCPTQDVAIMDLSKTQRALSLSLAALMFTSSVSFSMDMHVCQGHIKSFSLFGTAKACSSNEESNLCKNPQQTCTQEGGIHHSFSKKPCCVNASMIFQSLQYQASLDLNNEDKPILPHPGGIAFSRSLMQPDLARCCFHEFHPHQPPLPERDTIILFQVFLN
ncbi:MAG: hypothetical protein IPL46_15730 [Saprospiraceae bacterium]|nr:hypothetical protein [Saprospiraceae bacterium]